MLYYKRSLYVCKEAVVVYYFCTSKMPAPAWWVKIAQALEVSLDYLTGNSDVELDKATLDRVQEVTKLTEKDKDYIFVTLDALIRDFKNKHAYAK